ncbi:hypothetical protein D9M71_642740 [compost metagenome]
MFRGFTESHACTVPQPYADAAAIGTKKQLEQVRSGHCCLITLSLVVSHDEILFARNDEAHRQY